MQTDRNRPQQQPKVSAPPAASSEKEHKKRKRDAAGDEIEELFSSAMGKKVKKAALVDTVKPDPKALPSAQDSSVDHTLADVMGAIRAAPGEGKAHGKRKSGRSS